MSQTLTPGQRAQLEAALRLKLAELDRRREAHQGGVSRAEHAHEVLDQDGDDAPQRDADREVDLALTDREMQQSGEVAAALRRVHAPDFGTCADCSEAIAFDRLKLEPWATRCVRCEGAAERKTGRAPSATL